MTPRGTERRFTWLSGELISAVDTTDAANLATMERDLLAPMLS